MPDSNPAAVYDCETYLKFRRAYLEAEIARLKLLGAGMKPAELRAHLAVVRELERELGEVMLRGHTLSHSPVSQQRITMANRTITSLMIANGAALGVIGAGLFESSEPGLVIHHLLSPALIFLAGLLAAGAIPPTTVLSTSNNPGVVRRKTRTGKAGAPGEQNPLSWLTALSLVCLVAGLVWAYFGAVEYASALPKIVKEAC